MVKLLFKDSVVGIEHLGQDIVPSFFGGLLCGSLYNRQLINDDSVDSKCSNVWIHRPVSWGRYH